ncbi:MAG: succinate--CoA ligase subunit alpha [Acidimicrobiales bacterium]
MTPITTIVPPKGEGVIIQGITGRQASFWTGKMIEARTVVVAGVSPGRGGRHVEAVPVYDTVDEATTNHPVGTAVLFTPPLATHRAAIEALDAGVGRLVLLAEYIPRHDTLRILEAARRRGARVLGPNTAGLVVPGECSLGIMPGFSPSIFGSGPVGVVSRSGSLGCLVCLELVGAGLGQSAFVGVGGDPVVGTTTREAIEELASYPHTAAVVIVGEVGGVMEEDAAEAARDLGMPVVAFIAGRSAPPGRRMGHAGAIVTGGRGTAEGKTEALRDAGVEVVETPSAIPGAIARLLGRD